MAQPRLPFLATLNLPDLSRLKNDPVAHDLEWSVVPAKLPSDIPKFEGKSGEDPSEHATTFHLWCSSNSLNHDSVRLRIYQRTLIGLFHISLISIDTMALSRGILTSSHLTHIGLCIIF